MQKVNIPLQIKKTSQEIAWTVYVLENTPEKFDNEKLFEFRKNKLKQLVKYMSKLKQAISKIRLMSVPKREELERQIELAETTAILKKSKIPFTVKNNQIFL